MWISHYRVAGVTADGKRRVSALGSLLASFNSSFHFSVFFEEMLTRWHRYNREGDFNASFAHNTVKKCPSDMIRACASRIISRCSFTNEDFRTVLGRLKEGDVAYCDPPYWPLSNTADFNRYHSEHFLREDHHDLVQCAAIAAKRGAVVVISNHLTSETLRLYEGASIQPLSVLRSISCSTRGSAQEAFFTYGGEMPLIQFPVIVNGIAHL